MLGDARPAASPHEQPVAIASLAKVMTAYLTLKRYPLRGAQEGFTTTVTAAQAQFEAGEDQSVVAVQAGEQLTERQLLEALLIPSGNNVAQMLAPWWRAARRGFVAEMNAEARALGMQHTTYTDPSGFDPGTVSTAADQLRVFRQAMRFPVFRQIVSMASVTLPVAGTLTNYNPLIAEGYAGKTGSDAAAGGCLAFFTQVTVAGRQQTAAGVVMGQGQGTDTSVDPGRRGRRRQRSSSASAASVDVNANTPQENHEATTTAGRPCPDRRDQPDQRVSVEHAPAIAERARRRQYRRRRRDRQGLAHNRAVTFSAACARMACTTSPTPPPRATSVTGSQGRRSTSTPRCAAGPRRVQAAATAGVHRRKRTPADGRSSQVRAVHAREGREGLPGSRERSAADQHASGSPPRVCPAV